MGWAKYYEDNLEIINERQLYIQRTDFEKTCDIFELREYAVDTRKNFSISKQKHYEDRYIVCKDCGRKVLFSAKVQKIFATKGWDAPKRCKCCREFRNTRYLMCSSF